MDAHDLAARRQQYERALHKAVQDIVAALSRRDDVKRAVLFGSYADGRRDLFTDLDILIVVESSQDFITRTAQMHQFLAPPVDMDLLVYTPDELRKIASRGFIRQALQEGTVIYEKPAS